MPAHPVANTPITAGAIVYPPIAIDWIAVPSGCAVK